jgi:hypothetical protein
VGEHSQHSAVIVGCGWQLELREDVGDMGVDRLSRHRQAISNSLVRSAFGHQGQNLALTLRQVVKRDRARRPTSTATTEGSITEPPFGDPSESNNRLDLERPNRHRIGIGFDCAFQSCPTCYATTVSIRCLDTTNSA